MQTGTFLFFSTDTTTVHITKVRTEKKTNNARKIHEKSLEREREKAV
jgi:hypothetical protein